MPQGDQGKYWHMGKMMIPSHTGNDFIPELLKLYSDVLEEFVTYKTTDKHDFINGTS